MGVLQVPSYGMIWGYIHENELANLKKTFPISSKIRVIETGDEYIFDGHDWCLLRNGIGGESSKLVYRVVSTLPNPSEALDNVIYLIYNVDHYDGYIKNGDTFNKMYNDLPIPDNLATTDDLENYVAKSELIDGSITEIQIGEGELGDYSQTNIEPGHLLITGSNDENYTEITNRTIKTETIVPSQEALYIGDNGYDLYIRSTLKAPLKTNQTSFSNGDLVSKNYVDTELGDYLPIAGDTSILEDNFFIARDGSIVLEVNGRNDNEISFGFSYADRNIKITDDNAAATSVEINSTAVTAVKGRKVVIAAEEEGSGTYNEGNLWIGVDPDTYEPLTGSAGDVILVGDEDSAVYYVKGGPTEPTEDDEIVVKADLYDFVSSTDLEDYLSLNGGTMSGDIDMGDNVLENSAYLFNYEGIRVKEDYDTLFSAEEIKLTDADGACYFDANANTGTVTIANGENTIELNADGTFTTTKETFSENQEFITKIYADMIGVQAGVNIVDTENTTMSEVALYINSYQAVGNLGATVLTINNGNYVSGGTSTSINIDINKIKQVIFRNCTFNCQTGGGIAFLTGDVTFENCQFIGTSGSITIGNDPDGVCNATFIGCEFNDYIKLIIAGDGSKVNIVNSVFGADVDLTVYNHDILSSIKHKFSNCYFGSSFNLITGIGAQASASSREFIMSGCYITDYDTTNFNGVDNNLKWGNETPNS